MMRSMQLTACSVPLLSCDVVVHEDTSGGWSLLLLLSIHHLLSFLFLSSYSSLSASQAVTHRLVSRGEKSKEKKRRLENKQSCSLVST